MNLYLTEAERRVAEMVWQEKSLPSGELVSRCAQEMGWKRSTTYTILKRLENKGVLENQEGLVIPRISQEEFDTIQGCQFIDESFGGSLPNFLTAFTRKRKLSSAEIQKLQLLIQEYEEEP